jgi:tyrosyl-tRNA synthetase
MIGDPTDKSASRTILTEEQVRENAQTYKDQAAKILDFDHPTNPVLLRRNSEWLGKMNFADVLQLTAQMTTQRLLERDMFQKRLADEKPIWHVETLYPLMQGWDSVNLNTDVEFGGSDQIFNMMVGRDLVRRFLDKDKWVVAGKLLADPSGKKIGKTEGNMVAVLDEPTSMFEKVMKWGDGITPHALELCTTVPMEQVKQLEEALARGEEDPRKAKMFLARTLVSELQSPEAGEMAERAYMSLTTSGKVEQMIESVVTPDTTLVDVLIRNGFATSRTAARRLIQQGGVRIDGQTIDDIKALASEGELQVGRKTQDSFRKIKFEETS